jgi:hypothetical protein
MFMKLVDVDPGPSANIDKDAAVKHNNKRFAGVVPFEPGGVRHRAHRHRAGGADVLLPLKGTREEGY